MQCPKRNVGVLRKAKAQGNGGDVCDFWLDKDGERGARLMLVGPIESTTLLLTMAGET